MVAANVINPAYDRPTTNPEFDDLFRKMLLKLDTSAAQQLGVSIMVAITQQVCSSQLRSRRGFGSETHYGSPNALVDQIIGSIPQAVKDDVKSTRSNHLLQPFAEQQFVKDEQRLIDNLSARFDDPEFIQSLRDIIKSSASHAPKPKLEGARTMILVDEQKASQILDLNFDFLS